MLRKIFLLFLSVFFVFSTSDMYGQCSISEPYAIADLDTTYIQLIIEGASNNDLANNNGLCGVALHFEHDVIQDIQVRLTSPSGQSIILVGPILSGSTLTSLMDWDITFVPCGAVANPDPGYNAVWSSTESWQLLVNYTGMYYPNFGCLEDFNSGPVDGAWTLEVVDGSLGATGLISEFELFFCQGTVACADCVPIAGDVESESFTYCEGNPDLLIDFIPDFNGVPPPSTNSYSYLYVISQNDEILEYAISPDLSSYPIGMYSVCGLSIINTDINDLPPLGSSLSTVDLLINLSTICAQRTTNCKDVEILELNGIVPLEATICQGDTFFLEDAALVASGTYLIFSEDGTCNEATEVTLDVINVGAFINDLVDVLDCDNPSIDLEGFNSVTSSDTEVLWYTTDVGDILSNPSNINITIGAGGTYVLQLTEGACTSSDTIVVPTEEDQISVEIIGENITCISGSAFLEVQTSAVVNTYAWFFNNIQIGSTNSINTSGVGEYTLEITSADGCKATDIYNVIADTVVAPLLFDVLPLDCNNTAVTLNTTGTVGNAYTWSYNGVFYSSLEDPVVADSGVYSAAVLGLNGCMDTFEYEVVIDTITPVVMYNINPISCEQPISDIEAVTTIDAAITWTHDTEPTVTGNILATTVPGTYYLEAIALNGCTFLDTFEVEIDTIVPAFQVMDAIIPCEQSSIQITNIYDPLDGISFTWSTLGGDFSDVAEPTLSDPGTYYVSAVAANGCEVIDSIMVSEAAGVPQFFLDAGTLDCNNSLATINTGLGAGYSFEWQGANGTTETTSSINVGVAGSYSVTVTDDVTNCINIRSAQVNQSIDIPSYTISSTIIDCINGTATVTFDDMDEESIILWSGAEVNIQSDTSFVTGVSGWYYLFGTATNGCEFTDSIEVIGDDNVPMLTFTPLTVDCSQDSFLLDYSSTIALESYSWGGPNGYESIEEFPMIPEAGNYVVNFIGVNGCTGSSSFVAVADTIGPVVNIQGDASIDCIDGDASLTVDVGADAVTYSWSGTGVSVTDVPMIEVVNGGFYTVIAAGANGCVGIDSFEVEDQSNYPDIEIQYNDINCYASQSTVTLINDVPNATILWTTDNTIIDGTSSDGFTTDVPALYTVVVDAGDGCVSTDNITIIEDLTIPMITTTGFDTITCTQRMLPLDIMVDSVLDSVRWSSSDGYDSDLLNPMVDGGGVYNVIVTAVNGCTAVATYEVEVDTLPPIANTVVGGVLSCNQSKIDLDVVIGGGVVDFYWEGPDSYFSLDSTPTVSVPGIYSLFQEAINGCVSISQTDIIDNLAPPDINAVDQNLPCNDEGIILQANSTDENITFNWFGPGFFSNEEFPMTNIPGEYVIIALGENGCIKNDTFEVTRIPVPPIYDVIVDPITCTNPLGQYQVIDVEDDEGISWLLPNNTVSSDEIIQSDLTGIFELIVIGTNGCADTAFISSQIDTISPIALISTDEFIMCENREITLNSLGSSLGLDYEYSWSSGNGQGIVGPDNVEDCIINLPATYTLEVLDVTNGCTSDTEIVVEEQANTFTTLELGSLDPSCYATIDGEVSIDNLQGGLGSFDYSLNGQSSSIDSTFSNLSSGMYTLIVTDDFGCTIESSVSLVDPQEILIDLISDVEIELGDSIQLLAVVNIPDDRILSVEWDSNPTMPMCIDCLTQYVQPIASTQYTIVITDIDGCQATSQVYIEIDESRDVYVPNVFSPNNDGVNDDFKLGFSSGVALIEEFHIFDRWGDKVFSIENTMVTDNIISWDATFNGEELNPDVYTFYLRFKMLSGSVRQRSGSLTIVK